MKNKYLRPFFMDMVKPQINFIDGDDDDFDLSGMPKGGGSGDGAEGTGAEADDKGAEGSGGDEGSGEGSGDGSGDGDGKGSAEGSGGESGGADDKGGEGEGAAGDGAGDDGGSGDGGEGSGEDGAGDKGDGGEGDGSGDESGKGADGAGGDGAGDGAGAEEDDFFGGINAAPEQENIDDFTPLASDLGFELENPKSRTEFVEKVNNQVKEAHKKVDLSGYTEPAQKLINHLEKTDGDLSAFFQNDKITQYNHFLSLDTEEKYSRVRSGQLIKDGLQGEEVETKIEEELENMSTRELKDAVDGFDTQIKTARDGEIQSVVGDQEKKLEKAKEVAVNEAKAEQADLIKFVESKDNFMGIPLTEVNKKGIVNAIKNGSFDLAVEKSQAESKFNAFMLSRFGDKFMEQIKDSSKKSGDEGYRRGLKKGKGTAFNQDTQKQGGAKGSKPKEKFADLQDME